MARTKGSKNKATIEFERLEKKYSREIGCPVKAKFLLANGQGRPGEPVPYDVMNKAQTELMEWRYSKPNKQETEQKQTTFSFMWDDEQVSDARASTH